MSARLLGLMPASSAIRVGSTTGFPMLLSARRRHHQQRTHRGHRADLEVASSCGPAPGCPARATDHIGSEHVRARACSRVAVDRERAREGPRCGGHVQRGDPQVSVAVFETENPYNSVEIRGTAELVEDKGKTLPKQLSRKYLGSDPPPESDDGVRLIVRVIPEKVTN